MDGQLPTHVLTGQLTLSQPKGADFTPPPTTLLLAHLALVSFLCPCKYFKSVHWSCSRIFEQK